MRSEIIKDMIFYTLESAASPKHPVFTGERLVEFELDKAKYITAAFEDLVRLMSESYVSQCEGLNDELKMDLLFIPYMYCFDKALEATCNIRTEINRPIQFDSRCFADYVFGQEIPEPALNQIIPSINNAEQVFDEAFKYTKSLKDKNDRQSVCEGLFSGAVQMGVELCLRLDM
jgi:hypothetical protein